MRSVHADFRRRRTPSRRAWLLCCMAYVPCLGLLAWAAHVEVNARRLLSQRGVVQGAPTAWVGPAPPTMAPPPYVDSARQMLLQRDAPWPEVLAALESIDNTGVAVESLELDTNRGAVGVTLALDPGVSPGIVLDELGAGEVGRSDEIVWRLTQIRVGDGKTQTVSIQVMRRSRAKRP